MKDPNICGLGNSYIMNGFDVSFRASCGWNIVLEIRDSTMEEPGLEGVIRGGQDYSPRDNSPTKNSPKNINK